MLLTTGAALVVGDGRIPLRTRMVRAAATDRLIVMLSVVHAIGASPLTLRVAVFGLSRVIVELTTIEIMLLFSLTKLINRTVGPKLLALGLRSSSFPSSSLLLPLAQYLISIEVRDDYRQLMLASPRSSTNINNSGIGSDNNNTFVPFKGIRTAWESFVDQTWSVLFENPSDRKSVMTAKQKEDEAEIIARLLYDEKSRKREERRAMRRQRSSSSSQEKQQNFISKRTQIQRNDIVVDESLVLQGKERVKQLGQYILPALLSVVSLKKQQQQKQQIQYNDHFVKWIRGEYLIARYGLLVEKALTLYPELRYHHNRTSSSRHGCNDSTTVGTNDDDLHRLLPSVDVVRKAFNMQDWCQHKVPVSSWHDEIDESYSTTIGHDSHDSNQNDIIERIIHRNLNGQVEYSGPINAYFEMRNRDDIYEVWTYEYIKGLAKYLICRIHELDEKDNCQLETTILDVGAGDGRLVHFLRRAMDEEMNANGGKQRKRMKNNLTGCNEEKQIIHPKIIATDDGSWNAPIYDNVERLSVVSSLEKYRPRKVSSTDHNSEVVQTRLIVLCSWMPPGLDWTKDFRHERQVEEYILIGECDDGTCGDNWLTWGNSDFRADNNDNAVDSTAPYVADGYERINLDNLSQLQFSRFDCQRSRESMTVSFRSMPG
jgi:hypothetical protein